MKKTLTALLTLALTLLALSPISANAATNPAPLNTSSEIKISNPTFVFTEGSNSKITLNYSTPNMVWNKDWNAVFVGDNRIQPFIGWKVVSSNAGAPFGLSTSSYKPDVAKSPIFTMSGTPQYGTAGVYTYNMNLLRTSYINGVTTSYQYPVQIYVVVEKGKNPPKPVKKIEAYANFNPPYDLTFGFYGMKVNSPYAFYFDTDKVTGADGLVPYEGLVPYNGEMGIQYMLPDGIADGWHKFEFKTTYFDNTALNYNVWVYTVSSDITVFKGNPVVDRKYYEFCYQLNAKYPYGVIKNSTVQANLAKTKALGYKGYVDNAGYLLNKALNVNNDGIICEA